MIFVVDNEINRLMNTHNSKNSFWVNIGVMEASDTKINALSKLKNIIAERSISGVFFNDELVIWYADNKHCLKIQRNKVHSFFQPEHKACTQTVVEEVMAHFGIDTKAMSSVQHFAV